MSQSLTTQPPLPRETRLRDWSEDQFKATYQCDRFTATVLGNRLRHTLEHMGTGLMVSSFSPVRPGTRS